MTIILNLKNYPEVLGEGSLRIAEAAQGVSSKTGARIIVAPPGPMVALVASRVRIPVFSQTVGSETGDKTTGAFLPEAVKAAGAKGTLLNHSESSRPLSELKRLVPRLRRLSLAVCLCADTTSQAVTLARLDPDYVAVEPPGLIGSGVAVSKAKPELVSRTVSKVKETGYRGKILCGAGIVSGEDVKRAVELGADGVLVSSSVVKARDWPSKIEELAHSLR
ncbi:MAG: triose-phosphate isomerase [Nitrososphaerales archaeon]